MTNLSNLCFFGQQLQCSLDGSLCLQSSIILIFEEEYVLPLCFLWSEGLSSSSAFCKLVLTQLKHLQGCQLCSVTELILAEFLYLQCEDEEKPIYLYINSTGTTTVIAGGEKLGYETEAFAIYDVMRYVKPPIFTLCVGNAWGEAALLLAAGAKGNRVALLSSTIMILAGLESN
ncbi:hypothetical protein Ancab_015588 [Ancistrocladus abbreviatus]